MAQQKSLYLQAKQGEFVVATRDIPKPKSGEILVKIHATGLNPIDWKIHKLGLPFVAGFPAVLGVDAAGVVEAVGEGVTNFKQGDRVFHQGQLKNDYATFQQYTAVPADVAGKLPERISFEQGATLPVAFTSAAVGLYNPHEGGGAGLTPPWAGGRGKYAGKPIVVLGGASSVGQAAIQLAKLSGFSPIIATASLQNAELLRELGATHVIDRKADVVAEVAKITSAPVGIVFDPIAYDDTARAGWEILAPNGQLVLTLDVNVDKSKYPNKAVRVFSAGSPLMHRDLVRELVATLPGLLEEGVVKPNRVEVLPGGLGGIVTGLERLQANSVSGAKLVALPQDTT